jgi:hypothetical protein
MSNRSALILGLVVLAALAADGLLNGGTATLFLARRLMGVIDWVAFWR